MNYDISIKVAGYQVYNYPSALKQPIIDVGDGEVTMSFLKRGRFAISDIDEIGTLSNDGYFIRVKGRNYGISPMLCQNSQALKQNMEALRRDISDRPQG